MSVVYWLFDETCSDPWHDGYVGVSVDPERRFKEHVASGRFPADVEIKVLFEGTEDECLFQEKQFRNDPYIGWNIAEGGGMPPVFVKHTEATKEKMRKIAAKRSSEHYTKSIAAATAANTGRKQSTEERQRRSQIMKGKNTWTKGSKRSEETKERQRQKMKGRNVTPGWKISAGKKGKRPGKDQTCPHCSFSTTPSLIKRWHGDNCKMLRILNGSG